MILRISENARKEFDEICYLLPGFSKTMTADYAIYFFEELFKKYSDDVKITEFSKSQGSFVAISESAKAFLIYLTKKYSLKKKILIELAIRLFYLATKEGYLFEKKIKDFLITRGLY